MMKRVLPAIKGVVAFYPELVLITKSLTAALLLSQLVFWMDKGWKKDGWIYKDFRQLRAETGLTKEQQITARKRLRDLGLVEEKKKGVPPVVHFRVNAAVLQKLWDENAASIVGKRLPKRGKGRLLKEALAFVQTEVKPAHISEIPSENTQKNTQKADHFLLGNSETEDTRPPRNGVSRSGRPESLKDILNRRGLDSFGAS